MPQIAIGAGASAPPQPLIGALLRVPFENVRHRMLAGGLAEQTR